MKKIRIDMKYNIYKTARKGKTLPDVTIFFFLRLSY